MARLKTGKDVYESALERFRHVYAAGHRVIITFSGGKDSTVMLELAIQVARECGRLPVEVVVQEEEISYPGTYEFIERTANRPEVQLSWLVMCQPMLNVFNRELPFFWVMDPQLRPDQWVREPPKELHGAGSKVIWTKDMAIESMVNSVRYPVEHADPRQGQWDATDPRQRLLCSMGLRVQESAKRLLGLSASGGYITGMSDWGAHQMRPIYDWTDGDVWKFIKERGCDTNAAYNVLLKMGVPGKKLRIGPPLLNHASITALKIASRAWPRWFDKVCARVPGARLAASFGTRVIQPHRLMGETWEQCFVRECINDAPAWISARATKVMESKLRDHAHHADTPFPESGTCMPCGVISSWQKMAFSLWGGDPYSMYISNICGMMEPEFFRPGSGTWEGAMTEALGRKVRIFV